MRPSPVTAFRAIQDDLARRRFLKFLAASPLLLTPGLPASLFAQNDELIASPDLALNVFDFEAVARRRLPPAHFGYMATGVDDDATVRANREGFERYQLRVRRLIDVSAIDMSVALFGTTWDSPLVMAPVGSQRAFHPEGEIATARAARSRKHLQILSTMASTGVEDVIAARGEPVWYQLYPTDQWPVTRALVQRAEAAGCAVLVLTVDLQGGSNRETQTREQRRDSRQCSTCHIFKALALGARAVCIGRPYLWGLAAFGQPGVEAVLAILRRELTTIMRQAGTVKIGDITRQVVVDRGR